MVLRGKLDDYTELPKAADALCVVEVADSSYERDSGEKLIGYARAGVEQYVILNLRSRTAEVYTRPDAAVGTYAQVQLVAEAESLALRVGVNELFAVPMVQLLP